MTALARMAAAGLGALAWARKGLSEGASVTEVLFEDRFDRADAGDPGPDWFDPHSAGRVEAGRFRHVGGWLAVSRAFPGSVRIECDLCPDPEVASPNAGLFLCGAEGFWNGYELYAWSGRIELRRLGATVAAAEPSPLEPGRRTRLFLQRRDQLVEGGGRRPLPRRIPRPRAPAGPGP